MQGRGEFGYGAISSTEGPGPGTDADFTNLLNKCSTSIFKINNSISTLEKAVRQIGTSSDSTILRSKIQHLIQETNTAVKNTKRSMEDLGHRALALDRQKKVQFDRLTNDFQDTVQRYVSVQKRVANKMRSSPSVPQKPQSQGTMGFGEEEMYNSKTPLVTEEEEERRRQLQAQMQQQDAAIDYDLVLIQEREEQIRQIEATMLDVNEIFRDLSMMVSEQGEMIDSIEANVDRAGDNVDEGVKQLASASKYQKKARKKMCCIFIILAVIAVIITIVLVVTLN